MAHKLVEMYDSSLHRSIMLTNVRHVYSGNFFIPEKFSVPLGFRIRHAQMYLGIEANMGVI